MDNALKNLLDNAVDAPYIKDLRDRITGSATRSTRDILQYLYRTYGSVNPAQLSANDESFRAPYDGSTDLEAYFNGIKDCLFMADKAGQPYSAGQTLTAATSAIIQAQRFPLAMREWHKLPPIATRGMLSKPRSSKNRRTRETMEWPRRTHRPSQQTPTRQTTP